MGLTRVQRAASARSATAKDQGDSETARYASRRVALIFRMAVVCMPVRRDVCFERRWLVELHRLFSDLAVDLGTADR